MARRKVKADHSADTRGDGWIGLPKVVANSRAYLSLSPFERAVFWIILGEFNGYNNGEIAITYEEIGKRLKGTNRSPPNNGRIARAIVTLVERGLLAEPTPGSWMERLAREYRFTFISWGQRPPFKSATNEYLKWTPRVKNDGDAASPEKAQSGDAASPMANGSGDARSPSNSKNGSFALNEDGSSGDAGSLLIIKPYPNSQPDGVDIVSDPEPE